MTAEECKPHHWRIEEAQGETSEGVCKKCGMVRRFKNWLKDTDFLSNTERRAMGAAG